MSTDSIRGNEVSSREVNELFHVLADPIRRTALQNLRTRESPVDVDDFFDEFSSTDPTPEAENLCQLRIRLLHVHLPKLADAGMIEYSSEDETIEPTQQIEKIEPYLKWVESFERQ